MSYVAERLLGACDLSSALVHSSINLYPSLFSPNHRVPRVVYCTREQAVELVQDSNRGWASCRAVLEHGSVHTAFSHGRSHSSQNLTEAIVCSRVVPFSHGKTSPFTGISDSRVCELPW